MPKEFVSETVFYDYKTPVTVALDKIRKYGAVVVMRGSEYYGMVDDRSIFRNRQLKPLAFAKSISVGKFSVKMPVLDSATSLGRLINYFHDYSAKALPYMEGKKITGVVRRDVVLSTVVSLHLLSKVKVEDMMSAPLVTASKSSNVAQAMNIMEKNRVARLAVLDGGRLTGLLTQRDISGISNKPQERLPEMKSTKFSTTNVSVESVMQSPVRTIDPSRPAEEAARQMLEREVSSLVVVKGGRPVGMITARDIIESAAATTAKTQSKVIISGLDEYTKEYEDGIRASVQRLVERIDKFERLNVDYVSVNVRRFKERNYEMKARLALQKRGTVFAHASGYSLDSTLSYLLESVYKRIKEKKEGFVSTRRMMERHYEE